MDKMKTDKKELKKFALTMCAALAVIGSLLLFKHKDSYIWFYLSGCIFFGLGLAAASFLKPIYIAWMRFAFLLSWINTRLILTIIFYLVFTPIGFLVRLFKGDLLGRKIDKKTGSYWIKKETIEFDRSNYERQF